MPGNRCSGKNFDRAVSVRPGLGTVETEIVGVGNHLTCRFLRLNDAVFDALALCVGFGLFLRFECQLDLLLHVGAGGVAHDRIDLARNLGVEFQNPDIGLRLAGLHGGFCRAVNLRRHVETAPVGRWGVAPRITIHVPE